jgi:hypothetical protein
VRDPEGPVVHPPGQGGLPHCLIPADRSAECRSSFGALFSFTLQNSLAPRP